jgi:hypothetical protein
MTAATPTPTDAPEQLALLVGELPDGTCYRITAELRIRDSRPCGRITQTRHLPVPDSRNGYRQHGSKVMQYSGRRLALIPEHLAQLQAELAEIGATVNDHGLDAPRLSAYLAEHAATR